MLRNTADSWGVPAKLFHWVMAALILAQIALGVMAASWRVSPAKIELFWHKSTGMLILALVALRLLWRLANPTGIALRHGRLGARRGGAGHCFSTR
jgi:cytochrome b561